MPIQFINGNKLKSCKTGLTNHTRPISHLIMPLVINVLWGRHTDTQTHTDMQTKTISRNHVATINFEFKMGIGITIKVWKQVTT